MKKMLFHIAVILFGTALTASQIPALIAIGLVCALSGLVMAGLECYGEGSNAFMARDRAAAAKVAAADATETITQVDKGEPQP